MIRAVGSKNYTDSAADQMVIERARHADGLAEVSMTVGDEILTVITGEDGGAGGSRLRPRSLIAAFSRGW